MCKNWLYFPQTYEESKEEASVYCWYFLPACLGIYNFGPSLSRYFPSWSTKVFHSSRQLKCISKNLVKLVLGEINFNVYIPISEKLP